MIYMLKSLFIPQVIIYVFWTRKILKSLPVKECFQFILESEIIQCIYFYLLVFIMLNMTPFFIKKGYPSCVPKNPMCCPSAPHTGVHWDTLFRLIKL